MGTKASQPGGAGGAACGAAWTRRPRRGAARGVTLLELTLVMSVLLVGFLAMMQSLSASLRLNDVNRESALATDAIRDVIESLQGLDEFDQVFALYNSDPGDDPGPLPAPGSGFPVRGLDPVQGDPDGLSGEIVFPTVFGAGGVLELREDLDMPELGMPCDLDGKNGVDPFDHKTDYRLLPVLVRVRWSGPSGERSMEAVTLLADR